MFSKSNVTPQDGLSAHLRRHQAQCSVCRNPGCQEIETAWLDWFNAADLADRYGLSRFALTRHMQFLGLDRVRQTNRKRLFEKILERVDITTFKGGDVVTVLKAYAALCDREESEQAASLPAQGMLDSVSGQEAALPSEDGVSLLGSAPSVTSEEIVPEIERDAATAETVPPLPGQDAANLESPVTTTVQ